MESKCELESKHEPEADTRIDEIDEAWIKKLRPYYELVVFNLDYVAAKQSSGCIMLRSRTNRFISNPSEDFVRICPKLLKRGIKIGIITDTDEMYYLRGHLSSKYIAGKELVSLFLKKHFTYEEAQQFGVVAEMHQFYRGLVKSGMAFHIKMLSVMFEVPQHRICVFDCDYNAKFAKGKEYAFFSVDKDVAFVLSNFTG